ncbi:MAG: indolepyruvate oxidoreductase subunit beta [Candidatus Heimdallarchaeota archaeon]|nr:indolepyruvate oxidoreductase subunit beta [Candidatus Heimdallarchaeota archaeon]
MNIIICGVGGNGVILTTRILAQAAINEGFNVRIGASHGLAIRGGTVVSYLRIGSDAKGVIMPQRSGDILLAFEPLEALRQMKLMKDNAKVLLNNEPYIGVDAHLGLSKYPEIEEIISRLSETQELVEIEASKLAIKAGSQVMTNVVMLGSLASSEELPIKRDTLLNAILDMVPPQTVESNKRAFEYGEQAFHEKQN